MSSVMKKTPSIFGEVQGVAVGTRFDTKFELHRKNVHLSPNQNICCRKDGVLSVILGLNDSDDGDTIIVIFKTKYLVQINRIIAAFTKNAENDLPIRVVRTSIRGGQYSPLIGYRYDGLYKLVLTTDEIVKVIEKNKEISMRKYYFHLKLVPDQPVYWQREPEILKYRLSLARSMDDILKKKESSKKISGPKVVVERVED